MSLDTRHRLGHSTRQSKGWLAIYGQMAKHGYKGLRNLVRTPDTAQLVVQWAKAHCHNDTKHTSAVSNINSQQGVLKTRTLLQAPTPITTSVYHRTAMNISPAFSMCTRGILPPRHVPSLHIQNIANACLELFTQAQGTCTHSSQGLNITGEPFICWTYCQSHPFTHARHVQPY